jgi:leucyl-tRNA synthetase
VDTTDPSYYKWTQWIFLQIFNSYFDPIDQKAKPIAHLYHELQNENLVVAPDGSVVLNPVQEGMEAISGEVRVERAWRELTPDEQRDVIDGQRLAYMDEVPVNWCPGLGTVLANEEVIDGRSEVGGFPVEKRPMRQWMLRITAYAERLVKDLDMLEWPDSLKEMQRNWIGRSTGAMVDFEIVGKEDEAITIFTTRPDTLFGATFMVLAPEHPLVDAITSPDQREAVRAYLEQAARKSERDRLADTRDKNGVFTGSHAINPVNDARIPIWVADYVLMGYGTGAIMAVPGQDERDWEFAEKYNLPIIRTVQPPPDFKGKAYLGDGPAVNSGFLDGLDVESAKQKITAYLQTNELGRATVQYKLRDWLFSRQRYWGEPFPILLDEDGNALAVDEAELPVALPEMDDFKPTGTPDPPLSKARNWLAVTRNGATMTRETNTMPQWAGSCWYYLRYIDPNNDHRFVDRDKERYWMPVDLYVGGAEHAVLHLLYARFWHKVLFDLGHVSTPEPFMRLINQGTILGEAEYHVFENAEGVPVSAGDLRDIDEETAASGGAELVGYHKGTGERCVGRRIDEQQVERRGHEHVLRANPKIRVDARSFKMSKSRGNVVNPDEIVASYGADAFRLYEMYMGPLEASKPWSTRDIIGMTRFLNGVWRNLVGDEESGKVAKIEPVPIPDEVDRLLHRTIKKVGEDIETLRFNTAIAELIKLNNELTGMSVIPRQLAEVFALLLAPFAPHLAEELWQRLGHTESLARAPWPAYDSATLIEQTIELPVQVNGKLRDKITVLAEADEATILSAAADAQRVRPWLEGKQIRKKVYVPRKLVNFVVG